MRHHYKGRKLGTNPSHTKAMKRSLTAALLYNDRIKTIESRAKEIRTDVDRVITWAKKGDIHSRRLAIARLGGDKELVREVFEKVAQGMFADREGGYTRIMKLGPRKGDGAPMVIMELCTEPVAKKAAPKKATKKAAPKKVEAKAEEAEEITEAADTADAAELDAVETIDTTEATESTETETPKEEVLEEVAEVLEEKEAAETEEPAAEESADADTAEEAKEEAAEAEEAAAEEAEAAEADTADAKEDEDERK